MTGIDKDINGRKCPYTYTSGFRMFTEFGITKRKYMELCDMLTTEINKLNNSNIRIEPEPITEGGFVFRGLDNIMYKTMRHNMCGLVDEKIHKKHKSISTCRCSDMNARHLTWPTVCVSKLDEWRTSDEVIFPPNSFTFETVFLKAFRGAPAWTMDELKVFARCLEKFGFVVKRYPAKKSLVSGRRT
jgi:hypothetical protein